MNKVAPSVLRPDVLSEHRFESAEQSMSVVARTIMAPSSLINVDVEWLKPEETDYYDAWATVSGDEMAREGKRPHQDDDYGEWGGILNLDINSRLNRQNLPIYLGRLGFGYYLRDPVINDDGRVLTRGTHAYPTVSRINQTLDDVFGINDGGLRARESAGGKFESLDAMRAFVEDGVFLVASEQPYQAHDIRDHLLGYVAMGAELVETLRERAAVYLDRHDSGVEGFKPFEEDESRFREGNVANLFSPSRRILVAIWQALDNLSGAIPDYTIFAKTGDEYLKNGRLESLLYSTLGRMKLDSDRRAFTTMYDFLNLESGDFGKHAADTEERFAKLQEALT